MTETAQNFESIQDIAIKLVQEQMKNSNANNETKERTIFVLGSKGVGKTTIINRFLDRDDPARPTLALEYSFGRRTSPGQGVQKQVCNVWELGCLANSNQLVEVPVRSHGIENFFALIVLDLSEPAHIWTHLEASLNGLREAYRNNCHDAEITKGRERTREKIGNEHPDVNTLELFPFPCVIVGGKYDIFQDLDSEIKKHVCRCLRSIAHTIGAALVFYSVKNSALAKTMRDTMNHLGFGSPSNPFRSNSTDYNGPLIIAFGGDSWEKIGVTPSNSDRIGIVYVTAVPQKEKKDQDNNSDTDKNAENKDLGFREAYIDELRAQKDEELLRLIKDIELKSKFETIIV
ncbi:cytoplasmic dynein 2 light intermediate chain 1 [Culicoides brevitarsis]|uniref:cytoplasmic dynein 2 light intermediate chain 1 n=1 Tax=Culicoides brevitarsis TaxID=469753 RepID=UPI00307BA4AC